MSFAVAVIRDRCQPVRAKSRLSVALVRPTVGLITMPVQSTSKVSAIWYGVARAEGEMVVGHDRLPLSAIINSDDGLCATVAA